VWLHSTSLGGVESQLERRRRHPSESASVPESLVRLSVGIEHVDDLWSDLEQALEAV
jgi:cystathionine gamma-synthase